MAIPVGYGDGTQTTQPGVWAFLAGIYAADYTTSTPDATVSNTTELNAAIAAASAGDVIRLADGTYSALTLNGVNDLTIEAATYCGAVFTGGISATGCTDLTLRGLDLLTNGNAILFTNCTRPGAHYTKSKTLSAQDDDGAMHDGIEWFGCVADMGWPDPPNKAMAGYIKRVDGGFSGTFVDGPQPGTIKKCIFMRSTEDNFKHTYGRNIGYDEVLFWGDQVDEDDASSGDYHPDAFQASSQGATAGETSDNVWMHRCAFINSQLSGIREGQGLWAKDGAFDSWTVTHCIGTSGLNSISLGFQNAHANAVVENWSCTQNIRVSNASCVVRDSIYGTNLVDGTAPTYDGNATWGFGDPTTIINSGPENGYWEPDHFLPISEANKLKGAYETLNLIDTRMRAEGLTGFVPSGWFGEGADSLGGGTIASAASLSGGDIGQTHAVAGGTLTAASTMDGGDIGAPTRALISWAEIEYAVEVEQVAGATITVASALSGGDIAQVHKIGGATLTSLATVSGGGIGGPTRALISWVEIEVTYASDQVAGATIVAASSLSGGAIGQDHAIDGGNVVSLSAITGGGIGQAHKIAGAELTAASSISGGEIAQDHKLAGATLSAASSITGGAIGVVGTDQIEGGTITSQATLSGGGVGQDHKVAGATLTSAASITGGSIGVAGKDQVQGATITVLATLTGGNLGQTHKIGGGNIVSITSLSGGFIGEPPATPAIRTVTVAAENRTAVATAETRTAIAA